MDIYVYDRYNAEQETFLGLVHMSPNVSEDDTRVEGWYKLQPRDAQETVSGEIFLELRFEKTDKTKFGPNDFQILKLIGKGMLGDFIKLARTYHRQARSVKSTKSARKTPAGYTP